MSRIYLIAGEESGDIHGAGLVAALRRLDPEVQCEGLGGLRMQAAGMTLHHDLAGEGIMGFTEVVKHFPRMRRLLLDTRDALRRDPPDAVVLIDYPGFNIRLAQALHGSGIPVIYYISPQVWAWKKKRIHTIAKCCTKMMVIFPFEEPLYQAIGMDAAYVGHPLLDHIQGFEPSRDFEGDPVIGILPGSRAQEIGRLLAPMLDVARRIQEHYPDARFVTPCANEKRADQIRGIAKDFPLEVMPGTMYDVLHAARFCLVASGTATLETALFGVPMIIAYRVSPLSYALARALVDIKHIGIVNILAGKGIVPEYVQGAMKPKAIAADALELIGDTPRRAAMLEDLAAVRASLGGGGASENAAREVLSMLHHGGTEGTELCRNLKNGL
ncbi:MAG: lipid-A-disaccharide synthase [Candidatus Hydrogenedens sp.]|nr:lipid-A-disaccharide synthase [Candidatus Hydrogenedens sp.]